jgi:hypothetical protein
MNSADAKYPMLQGKTRMHLEIVMVKKNASTRLA